MGRARDMDFDQLVAIVRAQSGAASDDQARESLLAVLEVVGAHVGMGGAQELAAELPAPAAEALRRGAGPSPDPTSAGGAPAQPGTGPQLYAQVADRLGIDEATAPDRVQGALRAIARGIDQDRLDRVRSQLPDDVGRMLIHEDEGDTSRLRTGA